MTYCGANAQKYCVKTLPLLCKKRVPKQGAVFNVLGSEIRPERNIPQVKHKLLGETALTSSKQRAGRTAGQRLDFNTDLSEKI